MDKTRVTIFPGPGEQCRVRELAPDCEPLTLGWFSFWNDAVEYIRENCVQDEAVSPEEFRAAYRECRQHH